MSTALPGQRAGVNISPRDVLVSTEAVRYGRGVIDAASACDGQNVAHEDELRPGLVLAQITATRLWAPCKRTTAVGAGATSTALTVVNATSFKVGDSVKVGANAAQAIAAINYASDVVTLTTAVSWSDKDPVATLDGSQIARGVLNEFVKLKDSDGIARPKPFTQMVVCGLVDPNQALNDLAAVRADTGHKLTAIQFADDAGQV